MKATILFDNGELNFCHLEYLDNDGIIELFRAIRSIESLQKIARNTKDRYEAMSNGKKTEIL